MAVLHGFDTHKKRTFKNKAYICIHTTETPFMREFIPYHMQLI